jgi:ketosteroid isomerase-like protein
MTTKSVANRLVKLCREGKVEQAQEELYAADAVSIEPKGLPSGALGNAKGLRAIIEKGRQFQGGVEALHGSSVSEPVVAGNWFSVAWMFDVTFKGRGRAKLEEIAVYHVRDGKIAQEQFFYDVG